MLGTNVLMSFIGREFEGYSKCAISILACTTVYRVTDCFPETAENISDDANSLRHQKCPQPPPENRLTPIPVIMSRRSLAGRLFHTTGPLTVKLRSP